MVVLKKEDRPAVLNWDSARRFGASFRLAWKIVCNNSGRLVLKHGLPASIAGLAGVVWLYIYNNVSFWGVDVMEILLHFLFGVVLLMVCSVMRCRQLVFLDDANSYGGVKTKRAEVWNLIKRAFQTAIPLLLAWLIIFSVGYVLVIYDVRFYIVLPALAGLVLLLMPTACLVQSYMEISDESLRQSLVGGLSLCRRYWGAFFSLNTIGLLILAVAFMILIFGEVILKLVFVNESMAMYMEEAYNLPVSVVVLTYLCMFVGVALAVMLQVVWTLPQQIHVRSVIYKETQRKKEAKKAEEPEREIVE